MEPIFRVHMQIYDMSMYDCLRTPCDESCKRRACVYMHTCVCVWCMHICMKIYDGTKCTFRQQVTIKSEKSYPYKSTYQYTQYTYMPIYMYIVT
jgi:hypothetical protein